MNYSLNAHALGYSLTKTEAFSLLTTTAVPYALRHRALAQTQKDNWLGHQVLFIAECLPIIGILVAAIEYLVAAYFRPNNQPADNALSKKNITPTVSPLPSPLPSLPSLPSFVPPTDAPKKSDIPDPMRPISLPSATVSSEEPIVPLPTRFSSIDALLGEAQDYFNNGTIPAPLTFPDVDVNGLSQKDLIETLLKKYNGLCVGESHNHSSPKYFITINMFLFKSLGVDTLYLEGYDGLQNDFDAYFAGDSVDLPLSIKNKIMCFYPGPAQGYTEMDVLMAAKRAGIRMVNIDSRQAHAPIGGLLRASAMNYQAKLIIDKDRETHPGGKSIVYAGGAHTNRVAGLPGLGQMFQFPAIEVEDRSPSFAGADATSQPNHSIRKNVSLKTTLDPRVRNIDFLIEMDTPLKS